MLPEVSSKAPAERGAEVGNLLWVLYQMVLGWGTVALVYFGVALFDTDPVVIPEVWLDRQLPFTEQAIWVYCSFFILIPYTYFTVAPERLLPLRYAMQISAAVSGLFFIFLPTSLIYPDISPQGISASMLSLLVAVDSPNNCFPSLHASLTTICVVMSMQRQYVLRSLIFVLLGLSVLLSIILLRRHLTIDVSGGVILGIASCAVVRFLSPGESADAESP